MDQSDGVASRTRAQPVLDAILNRHSTRGDFTERPVEPPVLEQIVRCGLAAPSSKNARPWRLHVVSDRGILSALADLIDSAEGIDTYVPHDPRTGKPHPEWVSTVRESAEILRHVTAGIFVENCGTFSKGRHTLAAASHDNLVGSLVGYTFELVGIGAAIENMWIGAQTLGVCATFLGDVVIAEGGIRDRLSIDGDLIGVLALGYSDAIAPVPRRSPNTLHDERVVWHGSGARDEGCDGIRW